MATVNLGRIKPIFKGAYAGGTAYVVDDIVTSGNETFICILASTGNATSNATYWTKLASKGADGSNGTNGTDVGTVITTQGDILYRDGSGLARLGYGTAGQVLKTGGSGANPSWGTVASKLLGNTTTVDQTAINFGDTNRTSAQLYTQLSTTHTAQSTASYFVIRLNAHGGTDNHQKMSVEWSKDNSNWYHTSEAGNAGFTAVSLSGSGISWASGLRYTHPQASFGTDGDSNRNEPTTATMVLKPSSSTHSVTTLYVRVWVFQSNSSSSTYINRNGGNSADDGVICSSALEINEYAL
tara:strand:- start:297 stop:1187 length:891 start_codon:yes stop_codon:yes gene_type:complete